MRYEGATRTAAARSQPAGIAAIGYIEHTLVKSLIEGGIDNVS